MTFEWDKVKVERFRGIGGPVAWSLSIEVTKRDNIGLTILIAPVFVGRLNSTPIQIGKDRYPLMGETQ
jgi:hypothetical protein